MMHELIHADPEEEKLGDKFDNGGWYWNDLFFDAIFSGPFATEEEAKEWYSKIL